MPAGRLIEQGRRTRAQIRALFEQGCSEREIVARLSLSDSRVRDLLSEMGLRQRAKRPGVAGIETRPRIRALHDRGLDDRAIAGELDLTLSYVRKLLVDMGLRERRGHVVEMGRRTRAKIKALFDRGLDARAIAENISLTLNRVLVLMEDMGLRARRPPRSADSDAPIFEDEEAAAFRRACAPACAAHLDDLKREHPGGYPSLRLPESDVVPTVHRPSLIGAYASPAALCADETDGRY